MIISDKKIADVLRISFLIACLAVILAYVALGYYSFPQVDDFDQAFWPLTMGYINMLHYAYSNFSGRLSPIITNAIINASPVFPFYTNWYIIGSLLFFIYSFVLFLPDFIRSSSKAILLADIAFLFLALPDYVKREAFYMEDFNNFYLLPVSLTLLMLTLIGQAIEKKYEYYLWGMILPYSIFIGNFSEPLSALLIIVIGAYLIIGIPRRKEPFFNRLIVFGLGIGIGFLIDTAAPGSYRRLGFYPALLPMLVATWHVSIAILPVLVAEFFIYGLFRAWFIRTSLPSICTNGRTFAWCVITILVACFASLFVVVYGYRGGWPSARTVFLPCIFSFIAMLLLSVWITHIYPLPRWKIIPCLLFLCLTPAIGKGLGDLSNSLKQGSQQRQIAVLQMNMAFAAKRAGVQSLKLPPIPNRQSMLYVNPPTSDPHSWINGPWERYFGIQEIRAAK